jgi:hypothetical protein
MPKKAPGDKPANKCVPVGGHIAADDTTNTKEANAGNRTPEHARSAAQIAVEESKHKATLLKWAVEIADDVIAAALDDVALHFLESDSGDDEQFGSLDLMGDYDPIIDAKTGSRLSEIIKQAAETFRTKTFRTSEKMLRRLYLNALKDRWEKHKEQNKKIPSEPVGKFYGRSPYMTNRHGVWVRLNTGGLDDLNVWRRIVKTCVEPEALSYDTTPQRNWRHRYFLTGETGQETVDIPVEHLGKDAARAINTLMRRGAHIVESRRARQHLAQFLRYRPRKRIIRAPRTGWFEWRGHWVFVLPDEVLGAPDKMHIALDLDDTTRSGSHGFHRAGTSEQWRQQVAFALVAATLAMAIEANILPWSLVDTDAAIIACMRHWLNQRGNIDAAGELLREIERRRRMFAATADDRLIHLDIVERQLVAASPADQHKMEAAEQFDGFFKNGHNFKDRHILLKPDAWRHLWAGLDIEAVKQHLLRQRLLIADHDGKVPSAEKYKSGAPTARFYVLASAFIDHETA